jgi:tripartite-type tricarboxylate transporter receptor subunit TctC
MVRSTESESECWAIAERCGSCSADHRKENRGWTKKAFASLTLGAVLFMPMMRGNAQDTYPSKPIRLVVPYGTGGVSDSVGRIIATALTKSLNQSVFVENHGGGGGTIGAAIVAKSPADGYTLLLTSPPMVAVAPVLMPNLSYNAADDFTPVGTFLTTPNILVVNPSIPAKTLPELVAYAKGPGAGKLSFASAGPGSTGHLSGQILMKSTGIQMAHVPYKSSGMAFPDVISGRVSMVFDSIPSTLGFVKSGHVRPIIVMSEKRSSVLPEVPTAIEAGFPTATMNFWMGIEAPAKLPQAVVQRLSEGIRDSMSSQAVKDNLQTLGAELSLTTPAEFAALRKKDIEKYKVLVKEMGLKQE